MRDCSLEMGRDDFLTFDELTTFYNMGMWVIDRAVKPKSCQQNVFIPHQLVIQLPEFLKTWNDQSASVKNASIYYIYPIRRFTY